MFCKRKKQVYDWNVPRERGKNEFRTVVSEVPSFVGNFSKYLRILLFTEISASIIYRSLGSATNKRNILELIPRKSSILKLSCKTSLIHLYL